MLYYLQQCHEHKQFLTIEIHISSYSPCYQTLWFLKQPISIFWIYMLNSKVAMSLKWNVLRVCARSAYHSRCIDPWLTKRRRVCPVCKQKVRVGSRSPDDSDSDDSDTERSTSERAPLLQQATQAVSSGTFAPNRVGGMGRGGRDEWVGSAGMTGWTK